MPPKKKPSRIGKPTGEFKVKKLTQHNDLPASVGLVKEMRAELVTKIESVDHKIESVEHRVVSVEHRIESVEHRIESLDHKIESVDHKVDALDHKIESVDRKVESVRSEMVAFKKEVLSAVHRTQTLMEEQRAENRIVLDGLKLVIERQDRVEATVKELGERT